MSVITPSGVLTSIVDNRDENTLYRAILDIAGNGRELWIATAFFSLDALNLIGEHLHDFDRVRLLFGSEASKSHRNALLRAMNERSEEDLLKQRNKEPLLEGLQHARTLIENGKLEARVYTRDKFHAKAYLAIRDGYPPYMGVAGSGNFTRQGLTENIELNVHLSPQDQSPQLKAWYEEMWEQSEADTITEDLKREIDRHLRLYEPRAIYLKALLEWGDHIQGRAPLKPLEILPLLDPHQEHAYRQALRILEREPGVMICDGVGLGKSFVALALMEHWLREGSRVLLVAPKAILKSSWEGYLRRYLGKYSKGFSNIHAKPMTWFGFNPQEDLDESEELREYAEQADVIIVDESHNFRNSATQRYKNLYETVAPNERGRKKIVLLTATPVNTRYEDLTNQFQILTHDDGEISGIARLQLNKQARNRDKAIAKQGTPQDQDTLFDVDSIYTDQLLGVALASVAIQRSRKTCRDLATAAGKQLRFPQRRPPREIAYSLGYGHQKLIQEAKLRFEELGKYLAKYTEAVTTASQKETEVKRDFSAMPQHGLKFSGYLPNLFLRKKTISNRNAQVEAFLAKMVFINVMKQLESSTPAFQSIIEALGQGLALRLRHYCGDDPEVQDALRHHESWIPLPENEKPDKDLGDEPEDAAADEASGGETDDFICREERRAIKRLKELNFGRAEFDVDRWRNDILADLEHLESVHSKCMLARQEPDSKLDEIEKHVREQRESGRKVLIFSQSRKTADYVQRELEKRLGERVGLANADVGGDTRARILNAFSPNYNDLPRKDKQEMKALPEMHILVSTDVLSEGVNLQEAGCILNYDLHWNPTRLIQRIGRVDRRLRDEDADHSFDILNVFPPKAIDDVISLVNTVERRQGKISRLLGIDVSFFKATDQEGTLREFNRLYEGGETHREAQLVEYVREGNLSSEEKKIAESLPPGAFGVWDKAPFDGAFGLFRIAWRKPDGASAGWKPEDTVPAADLRKFGKLIGAPRLLLLKSASVRTPSADAPAILDTLSGTTPGEKSGRPKDPGGLKDTLSLLRLAALNTVPDRTQNVTVDLVCWMELQHNG
ncbi:MAG TPA: helicase-related protein [Fimbriimonadaceae bacterium]|nr:helicase-related protein [Fimbriimonadaceae bacterium]